MQKLVLARLRILFILVLVCFIILTGRLAYLQVIEFEHYRTRADHNRITRFPEPAPRGQIYDREGEVLVTNRPGFVVSLMDLGDGFDEETISFLSDKLNMEEEEIWERIRGQSRFLPVNLREDISDEVRAEIAEQQWKYSGISIDAQYVREYKYQEIGSHVMGYTAGGVVEDPTILERWEEDGYQYDSRHIVGQEGLERIWEPYLRGEEGEQLVEINRMGQKVAELDYQEPEPGHNLHLTKDAELQEVAYRALGDMVEELQQEAEEEEDEPARVAKQGSLVVLDPNTGAIRAMVKYPGYDPNQVTERYNEYSNAPGNPLYNDVIRQAYPIGSTYKPVTGVAALEEGEISDSTTFRCAGTLERAGTTKSCLGVHGSSNIYRGMSVSCNIFFYNAGLEAGIDALAHYTQELGLGKFTGLEDIYGENKGTVASREYKERRFGERWYPAETMDAAIGQTFHEFTPLQMAVYASMLANGGTHYRPYLVEEVRNNNGETVMSTEPEIMHEADISRENMEIIQESMREVVATPGGTAYYLFEDLEIETAGKTGTAQVGGGITPHGLYISYAPFDEPEVAVAAIIENAGHGSTSAAPVVKEVLDFYFNGTEGEGSEEVGHD